MRDRQQAIIDFWFKDSGLKDWFQKNEEFDTKIKSQFTNDYTHAMAGNYDNWMETAEGSLALIILLDQFPRNMFRGTPQMFASDAKALEIANHGVDKGWDANMTLHEKVFAYLPFEHSENLKDQERSLELFDAIKDEGELFYDYAVKHYEVIKEFGRFPHRNAILGRDNTAEEEAYLSRPDSGF